MKYDEKKYYDEQKERIIIYMKYNVKGFKEIQFEEQKENPLDGFVITGYINNDKTNTFQRICGLKIIINLNTSHHIVINWIE